MLFVPMGPGFPPPSVRPLFLLPASYGELGNPVLGSYDVLYSLNRSENSEFRGPVVMTPESPGPRETSMPFFPELSEYWMYINYTYNRTGDRFIAAVWYFPDRSELTDKEKVLADYLSGTGTVVPLTLDLTPAILETGDPVLKNTTTRKIPVTAYESGETSGYFFVFEGSRPSTAHHYIAYYGMIGPGNLSSATPLLEQFFIHLLPTLDSGNTRGLSPGFESKSSWHQGKGPR